MDNYTCFASVYDSLMWDFEYDKVYKFIDSIVKEKNIRGNKCLELCCGTGNLTQYLVEDYIVDAIDLSEDMLSMAYQKLSDKNVKFYKQDMNNLMFDDKFDLVVSSCDSINYLLEEENIENLFKWVYEHLHENGLFIFDMNSIYKFKNMKETYVDESEDVFYIWENFYDEENNLNTYSVNFFKNIGDLYERFYEEHIQRAYSIDYLINTLKDIGFKVQVFDDYSREINLTESSRLTFVVWR